MKTVSIETLDSYTVQFGDMPRIEHWRKGETHHDVPADLANTWVGRKLCRIVGGGGALKAAAAQAQTVRRKGRST